MAGPTYISNPALWAQFHHTDEGENFIPMIRRNSQRGCGILNRRRAYMIPVRAPSLPKPDIQQVSPVAAEQERAMSELKESMRNDEPHMPLKKSIKRRKKRATTRRSSNTKGKGRFKKKKRQGRQRINSLKKKIKKKKTLKTKKKTASSKKSSLKGTPIF